MTDRTKQSRRRILKAIAAGGGVITTTKVLPERWAKPVVDSVLLPVHAAASPGCTDEYFDTSASRTGLLNNTGRTDLSDIAICATREGSTVTVSLQGSNNILLRRGDLDTSGSFGYLAVVDNSPNCTPSGNDLGLRARITAIDGDSITIEADDFPFFDPEPAQNGFRVSAPSSCCGSFPALTGSGGDQCT